MSCREFARWKVRNTAIERRDLIRNPLPLMPEFQRSMRMLGRRPSTQQFIDTIIKKYGTHILISATLGGNNHIHLYFLPSCVWHEFALKYCRFWSTASDCIESLISYNKHLKDSFLESICSSLWPVCRDSPVLNVLHWLSAFLMESVCKIISSSYFACLCWSEGSLMPCLSFKSSVSNHFPAVSSDMPLFGVHRQLCIWGCNVICLLASWLNLMLIMAYRYLIGRRNMTLTCRNAEKANAGRLMKEVFLYRFSSLFFILWKRKSISLTDDRDLQINRIFLDRTSFIWLILCKLLVVLVSALLCCEILNADVYFCLNELLRFIDSVSVAAFTLVI